MTTNHKTKPCWVDHDLVFRTWFIAGLPILGSKRPRTSWPKLKLKRHPVNSVQHAFKRSATQCPFPRSLSSHLVSDGALAVTLLSDGELDTLALGQGDPGLVLSDDEDVGLAGGERVVNGILEMDDVETSVVTLTMGDDTNTTHIATTGDHGNSASVELDKVGDLTSLEVDLDSVVDLDGRVGVADTIFFSWIH